MNDIKENAAIWKDRGDQPLLRVVVADGNWDVRRYLTRLLKKRYDVYTVRNGEAAIAAIRELQPALIISNVSMPRLDGVELLKRLRADKTTRNIPLILLRGRAQEESRLAGLNLGVDDYLVKPCSARELLARIESTLARSRVKAEADRHMIRTLENLAEGVFSIDADWRCTYVNIAMKQRWIERGHDPESMWGKHIFDAFPQALETEFGSGLAKAMQDRVTVHTESYYQPFKCCLSLRHFPTSDGGLSSFCLDITERKRAIQSLSDTQLQIQLISDVVPALISYVDRQLRYRFCNQAYTNWFRLSSDEIIGKHMREVVGEAAWKTIEPNVNAALSGVKADFEAEAKYARGGTRWIHATYTPHTNNEGTVVGVVIMVTDITTRKKHERQLTEQARLLDLSTDAIIVRDMQDRIVYWNRGAEELYGYANHEALGKLKFDLLKTGFSEPLDSIRATLYRDDRWSGELTHTCKNGIRIVVTARWVLDRESHGNPVSILETTNDITPRKRSEQALRAKEEQLQRIDDLTPVCLTECGRDLRYKFVNRAYAEMLGVRPEEIVGRTIVEVMGAEAFATIEPHVMRVLRGERVEYECEISYRSVGRRFVHVIYVPQTDEHGEVEGWVASISDITESKVLENVVAEGARQNSAMYDFVRRLNRATCIEQIYEAALDSMVSILRCQRASILLADQTGVMRFVAWRRLSDAYRAAAVEGHSPWNPGQADPDVIPIDDVSIASLDASLVSVLKKEGIQALCFVPLTYEAKVIGKFMMYYDEPHPFTTDQVQLALAISRQLALAVQRKRAEDSRRESETLFRTLAESAPVMIWISGPDNSYSYFNRPWLQFTGKTLEQETDSWLQGVHPDDLQRCMDIYNISVDARLSFEREYRLRRYDGEYRWVLDHGIPRVTSGEIFIGYIGSCIDITDRKRAEDALKDADRRKDEFLAALAHELRNPLAPLRNGLEVMKLAADHPESVDRARDMMERQLDQLVRLVNDLMDVSRISQGKIVLQKERIELAEVVRGAREICDDLIQQAGHELVVKLPDEPVYVDGDKVRLIQILSNLLGNAAKYMERGGRIWLRVERHQTRICVSVRDSGIGIPENMLPKVFDLFTQVDGSREKTQGGLGIGLTIAQRLVAMHGGTLEVFSEGIGKGSEFRFALSDGALSTQGTIPQLSDDERTTFGRKRILIADDNEDVAGSLEVMLKIMGHEVRTANDGREAVELARKFHPDVVLLDIGMPNLNGYDACRQIRKHPWSQTHKTVMVALTGWGQEEARAESQAAGFDHHFVKPIDPTALKQLLKDMQSPKALGQSG